MIIPPSVDPFSANIRLTDAETRAALGQAGLVETAYSQEHLEFTRRDGSIGRLRTHSGLVLGTGPIPGDVRLAVQVSRWDRLKDMVGVLAGFVDNLAIFPDDVHLALVGPETSGVSDDPEGAQVLEECRALWEALLDEARRRVHLVCLPMGDVDENARLVNASSTGPRWWCRRASWRVRADRHRGDVKAKPVVASAVGGILDQIDDEVHGLLLEDPTDLDAFAKALARVVRDPVLATGLGEAARVRVQDEFLGDRHLIQYAELFGALLG